ncbi:purine permease [Pseudomonas sp. JQ170]|uniref:nucleobase:cation symporter-2 family protein n=1 Tax=unclassified Pseudomonas TaxID=196821 RepID=UPI000F97FDB3|nr:MULTISPECIES: nucleobase:cation symporter-2 family protein [unclassified Pseudomonas]MDN7143350.1 purine permease [Pseudomonas sp. JQ170]WRO78436.1 nucleobase:cation symporter-2 family protein [Pseudomonas sp. 170C]
MTSHKHPVDQLLPVRQMVTLGIQHMAICYLGSVAVPLLVASSLKLSHAETVILISTTLFCTGIATLLQTVGFWKFGVRLPVLQGAAFSSVGPVIAIGSNPDIGIAGICGAVIGAGVITMLAAPMVGRMRPYFPPVVIGCIVTVIGLQLLPVAYSWAGGGKNNANYGAPAFLLVSAVVLVTILAVNRFGNPMMRNLSVLIGMVIGTVLGCALGMGDFSRVGDAPWLTAPYPFYFGVPTFAILPIATMLVVMIVQMVESMGLFVAIGDIVDKPIKQNEVVNGLRANGLSSAIAGCFAAFPFIAHMENVGLVILSGVRSRWVVATSGVIMCLVALVPKAGAVIASTPAAALGGAAIAMFGVVAAAGIQTLAKVDYENSRHNVMIVAFSISVGLVPVLAPTLFSQLPAWSQPFLHSSVVIACIVAVLLNVLLNGVDTSAKPVLERSSHGH